MDPIKEGVILLLTLLAESHDQNSAQVTKARELLGALNPTAAAGATEKAEV